MTWQRATIADLMGHRIIYRNLAPVDPTLDGLTAVWNRIGLDHYQIPRKTSAEYAKAVWLIVQQAQALRGQAQAIERVLLIGDSARNDGAVARNMGADAPSRAFIGFDEPAQPKRIETDDSMMTANRWSALGDMLDWLERSGFICDERTAVLVDLDKTTIGARGRNDRIIDLARVRAAERTAATALAEHLDVGGFRTLYSRLNRADCHWITEDNQDYVAYMSLMVSGGAVPAEEFWAAMEARSIADIASFSAWCERNTTGMNPRMLEAHREVRAGILAQDPTPFKSFRRDEFRETIALMDVLDDGASADDVLQGEIVITAEVADLCRWLSERGSLIFGLSDKPDEASIPSAEALASGQQAIHDTLMKVYGESIL